MSHEDSWLLLPWLANGRLAGAERARLEQHVRACRECTRELALQQRWRETLLAPERIDAATPTPAPAVRPPRVRAAWRPPGLAWAASFVLCVTLGIFAMTAYRWAQPLYVTHTTPSAATPGVLHIAFERSVAVGDAEQLLLSAGARVVEGPDASGVFGVAPVNAAGAPDDAASQRRALAARLRADARVRWIEPLPQRP